MIKGFAVEDKVYNIIAGYFIKQHNLSSSSVVLRSINSLLKSELVYSDLNENGDKYYFVYDVFFQQWINEMYR
ncbi:MAG: hypothetical protein ACP5DZ_06430 [Bacteroidales bacterium]